MKRISAALLVTCFSITTLYSQYADLGTGALKDKIWWFDWNGFSMSNGASRTFTTTDGLTVTISFSNVQGPICQPYIMNTWWGAVLHFLYDFSNPAIKPAFNSPQTNQTCRYTLNVTATRNGLPVPFKFVAADAEGSGFGEALNLVTTGGNWSCIDFFRNSNQTSNPFLGCNTTSATFQETYGGAAEVGQNPVIATDAPNSGTLSVSCTLTWPGEPLGSALTFGIFAPIDRGDLPASYGYAQHKLAFTGLNQCNYLPPLPSLVPSQTLKLGTIPGDADAIESLNDNVIGADEDGISSFPFYTGNGTYSLTVNLANTTGANAYLVSWFDYNRNGLFENNERVTNILANNTTSSIVTWNGLPAGLPGTSITPCAFRFRLSSDMALTQSATGFAPDGEIEDYYETITHSNTVAGFSIPDTVCVNTSVTATNTSANATTSYWNFCTPNINSTPTGTNLGNIGGQFTSPVFMDYAQYNGNYYGFVTNNTPGKLVRLDYGNSLLNTPVVVSLGNFGGIIPDMTESIKLVFSAGKWYAMIVGGTGLDAKILKFDFGPDLTNPAPTSTNWGNLVGLSYPRDIQLVNENGNWYAFVIDATTHLIRYSFGSSLDNAATAFPFGSVHMDMNNPTGIYMVNDNGQWHAFITNIGNGILLRLDFGNSVTNAPTGVSLGNFNGITGGARNISISKFCDEWVGFVVNAISNDIVKLNFPSLTSVPTAVSLGNIGNLFYPRSISRFFRVGADLYSFIPNELGNTITRIKFTGCTNSSIPNYSGATPPPFTYNTPGTYNINLTVDDGLPTQASICKQIVVTDCKPEISNIINDYTEVLAFDPCRNALTVSNATAYDIGDTVLLIQMKGAEINLANNVSFGNVTNYRNAGHYEFNYVKNKTGNIIELKNILTSQYDIPDGVVQLVRVPYYEQVTVTSTLTCLPWDGSKGGVLAFNVRDTLLMNSNIDVSGRGFRGGDGKNSGLLATNCFANNFSYPSGSTLAHGKGEGIAIISNANSRGKGAAANAGGGGVDHNSGGGGGGNGSTGGFGGFQLESCGNAPFNNRGIGGSSLANSMVGNPGKRIYMGGGGGGGHANNPANASFPSNGGNGGGIIIVSAQALQSNSFKIIANGSEAPGCPLATTGDCHDGMGGGGAAGTVLLTIPDIISNTTVDLIGGKGADVSGPVLTAGRIGPGGGGSSGVFLSSAPALPANLTVNAIPGWNGVLLQDGNNVWGASAGGNGISFFNLQVPIGIIPFKPNIDSVRIKNSITSCSSFDFKGFGYTNSSPIISWQWYFGDGGTDAVQNTSHTYTTGGTHTVKLVVTDINGCKDSVTKDVTATVLNLDFTYQADACNPFSVQFNALGTATQSPYWAFGDATSITGVPDPVHVYPSQSSFIVKYSAGNGVCIDTVTKTINLAVQQANIVFTPDTTICYGATKQLRAETGLGFCWSPATYLDNPNVANPVTSTPHNITYYYTAQVVTGNNLITNGDFSQGNTGFTCAYNYANTNTTEGQYFVGPNPRAWHSGMPACTDHTTGSGNMLLVNGAEQPNVGVWTQTITVQPNTNYAFSAWLEHITIINPASLQFSINGIPVGDIFHASDISCLWQQFYTTWNSGNNTSAVISIINQNLLGWGNDFALDDIAFAPITTRRDSVKITVDTAFVKTNEDDIICEGKTVQLNTTGGISYTWTQAATLSDAGSPNPVAAPVVSTQYIVTGTNANGCSAKDTVNITVNPKPNITKSPNKEICKNASVQIFATGGGTYAWTPAISLDDPTLSNPTATPTVNTRYYVTVTGTNTCVNKDSVDITIRPDPVFSVGAGGTICEKDSIQLTAAGGNIYSWQSDPSLNNPAIANPRAAPATTTDYFVTITETVCNISTTLPTRVVVNPLPPVKATKSNDLDCSNDRSQLNATGAASYTWTPAASLSNAGIEDPVARPTTNTQYIVKGTDALGCVNYDSVIVSFLAVNAGGYLMPNAFTPNHDGLNDCYGIKYWGVIRELEFSIFNRWGQRIFFTKDPNACWDGSYKGKMQDIGVYVYMISAKTLCGDAFKKGTFTLAK